MHNKTIYLENTKRLVIWKGASINQWTIAFNLKGQGTRQPTHHQLKSWIKNVPKFPIPVRFFRIDRGFLVSYNLSPLIDLSVSLSQSDSQSMDEIAFLPFVLYIQLENCVLLLVCIYIKPGGAAAASRAHAPPPNNTNFFYNIYSLILYVYIKWI